MPSPARSGPAFQVNPPDGTQQLLSQVTGLANGRFVVTWVTFSYGASVPVADEVLAQVFNADGSKFGGEIRVNPPSQLFETAPSITALSNGGFVIGWDSRDQRVNFSSSSATFGQVFNPQGGQIAVLFGIGPGTYTLGSEVAALSNGRFVTAWDDANPAPGSVNGLHMQIRNAQGSQVGAEIVLAHPVNTSIGNPEIVELANGKFVVAYATSDIVGGSAQPSDIAAQIFNANGTVFNSGIAVNSTTSGYQMNHDIAALKSGGFVSVWADFTPSGGDMSGSAIRGQVFSANGRLVGTEFLVNTATRYNQDTPEVATLSDGRFVVVWADSSRIAGAAGIDIRGQIFNANGSKSGTEFIANALVPGWQKSPAVAALADGRFVVSWDDPLQTGSSLDTGNIRAQVFDPRTSAATFAGTSSSDNFVGTALNDTLSGGLGGDRLNGGQGSDLIRGDGGADVLSGGAGADTFVYAAALDSGATSGSDFIRDFQAGVDRIDLSTFMAGGGFVTGGTFSSVAGQVIYDLAARTVFGDMNGDGIADFGIRLSPTVVVTGSDFLF